MISIRFLARMGFITLTVVVLSGCIPLERQETDKPKSSFYETYRSTGRRVVIENSHPESRLKLRIRNSSYKVYDHSLVAVGKINITRFTDIELPEISVRALDQWPARPIQKIDDAPLTFALEGAFTIYRDHQHGWIVNDAQGESIAQFVPATQQDQWQMMLYGDHDNSWTTKLTDHYLQAASTSDEMITIPASSQLSSLGLLATQLLAFDALHRSALAAWFTVVAPVVEQSN